MSYYGWDPACEDGRRDRAIQAKAVNTPMADVLDFIGGDIEAQGEFEDLLQRVRFDCTEANCFLLSLFLDEQAEARARGRR